MLFSLAVLLGAGCNTFQSSRDDWVEVIECALKGGAQLIDGLVRTQSKEVFCMISGGCLSQAHRVEVGRGCAVVALATERPQSPHCPCVAQGTKKNGESDGGSDAVAIQLCADAGVLMCVM